MDNFATIIVLFTANIIMFFGFCYFYKMLGTLEKEINEKDKIKDKTPEIIRAQKDVIQKQEASIQRLTVSKLIFLRRAWQ